MQITGGYRCVQNALYKITSRIRDNLLSNEVPVETRAKSGFKGNKDTIKGKPFPHRKSAFPSRRFPPQVFFTSFVFTIFQFLLHLFLVFPRVLARIV